jgi:hypothetical protein
MTTFRGIQHGHHSRRPPVQILADAVFQLRHVDDVLFFATPIRAQKFRIDSGV